MKRTFRLQINRIDYTQEPNKGVYIPVLNNERIIIEFQCEAETTPRVTNFMELFDKPKRQEVKF